MKEELDMCTEISAQAAAAAAVRWRGQGERREGACEKTSIA